MRMLGGTNPSSSTPFLAELAALADGALWVTVAVSVDEVAWVETAASVVRRPVLFLSAMP